MTFYLEVLYLCMFLGKRILHMLEYTSNVWSPHLIMHINAIERVQRHFTKRITELLDFSYRERLSLPNLDTLEYRRLSSDLTLYYKVFKNLTPWSPSEYFNVSLPLKWLNLVRSYFVLQSLQFKNH